MLKTENKQLFLNLKAREGQHYSLKSDKTGVRWCYYSKTEKTAILYAI